MPINNDQFLVSTLAIDSQPVNANECNSIQKLDYPAIPNSIPAKYLIVFQMNNGLYYKWTYLNSTDRDNEFATIQSTVTTTIIAYDPDALSFIAATGITGTEADAINQLVLDLKADSLWSKFFAIYPIVGGTSTTHRYNLINVSNYLMTFIGPWVHSSTGALPDGVSTYAYTGIFPNIDMTGFKNHISFYSRTNASGLYADIGSYDASSRVEMMTRIGVNLEYSINQMTPSSTPTADSKGLYTIARTGASAIDAYKNGSSIGSSSTTWAGSESPYPTYIGARNLAGSPNAYSTRECALAAFGTGTFSSIDASNLYTAVQNFQTTLGRQV